MPFIYVSIYTELYLHQYIHGSYARTYNAQNLNQ